jgi:hypothetical protein
LPHSSQLDRRDRHLCHVALCDPARLEGEEGAGNPPELVGRRLVGLVDAGRWSQDVRNPGLGSAWSVVS